MPLWVTIQPWSSAMNILKQYGVYFVQSRKNFYPRRDLNPGPRPQSKSDDLDRSAIGPAIINQLVIFYHADISNYQFKIVSFLRSFYLEGTLKFGFS